MHEQQSPASSGEGGRKKTILLAEDTATLRHLYTKYISDAGYRAIVATDGVVATEMIKSGEAVDLLLTDYHMPNMNGIDLARWFHERFPAVPVLFISATTDDLAEAEVAMPYANCEFKPVRYVEFCAMVDRAMRGVRVKTSARE